MYINGLPVVDATKPLEIDITDTDVAKGNSKDPASCAAAQACMRQGFAEARVHLGRTYVRQGKKWLRLKTPNPIRTEIVAFDRGAMFSPGHYVFNPPHKSDSYSYRLEQKRKKKVKLPAEATDEPKKPAKKKSKQHRVYGVRQRGANV